LGLYREFEDRTAAEVLSWALSTYGDGFAIATSFQKEEMVMVDLAAQVQARFRIFTLDTGRLPEETYRMMEAVRERYGVSIEVVFPDREDVERMVADHGPNLFYQGAEQRHMSCEVRKVRPLQRKLLEFEAWATGLRRQQAPTRAGVQKVEEIDGRLRVSPLADWSAEQVDEYIREHRLPLHPLYGRGYTSIGCAPCTRAVKAGEDERAGRWWWEQGTAKECGIHFPAGPSIQSAP
jgi:thioredoxin-dependent adenylylsulfate APS reductase